MMIATVILIGLSAFQFSANPQMGTKFSFKVSPGAPTVKLGVSRRIIYISMGEPMNGLVIGINKFGVYGKIAAGGSESKWGQWLHL